MPLWAAFILKEIIRANNVHFWICEIDKLRKSSKFQFVALARIISVSHLAIYRLKMFVSSGLGRLRIAGKPSGSCFPLVSRPIHQMEIGDARGTRGKQGPDGFSAMRRRLGNRQVPVSLSFLEHRQSPSGECDEKREKNKGLTIPWRRGEASDNTWADGNLTNSRIWCSVSVEHHMLPSVRSFAILWAKCKRYRPNIATKILGPNYFPQYKISTNIEKNFGDSVTTWLRDLVTPWSVLKTEAIGTSHR
jgi:hypothetical protein